ncbi:MAG: NADP-dependent isocitrate dehydrogenase [Verrucomicrobia bacterium]|nr:NADP-dependent isocitrate dehydrogenase [Verrucomicrobiota bacterium]
MIPIAIAHGDGIGPEIMKATLLVLEEAGAPLELHEIEIGEKLYLKGIPTGIEAKSWETIRRTKAFLKAPITTPQGGGFKSLNVTIRTTLGLYANVRPCVAYGPFVATKHPGMDVVIVRENEEDLYSGIEYRQTPDVQKSLKIISRPGSEKIIRYAFEYARHYGRKKVTCFSKDNIMKISDGLFHRVFDEIAKEYPDIENEHWIVDIGAAKLADTPTVFDVIVMPNLYGDILSDVAAQISGSVGIAGSANIGDRGAMFEAIHGSAPRRAGQNLANPSGLLLASVLMLVYLEETEVAERIHNAWLSTIENGIHTYDIFKEGVSKEKVGTQEFAAAVVRHLGNQPRTLPAISYKSAKKFVTLAQKHVHAKVERKCVGVDLFVYSRDTAESFIKQATESPWKPLTLQMITNRGVRVWPEGQPETFCVDQWRLRFMHSDKTSAVSPEEIIKMFQEVERRGFEVLSTENLYNFDGAPGFSSAQG